MSKYLLKLNEKMEQKGNEVVERKKALIGL